jgi:DNA-binding winged helix-turn-helix (wHTH) protein
MTADFQQHIFNELQNGLTQNQLDVPQRLYRSLRLLAKARAHLITQQLVAWNGTVVRGGPFAGMNLTVAITEGCSVPKMLGCYEAELHEIIAQFPQRGYQNVIDLGCAEGYYAVGLARMLPAVQVFAHDTNPLAQETCRKLATDNQVANRVHAGGLFQSADFARFTGTPTLLVCDIEGAELQLLDPQQAPALSAFDMLVEMHDVFHPQLSQQLLSRFQSTHEVQVIPFHGARNFTFFPELQRLEHLDCLLATWEWRSGPTPWGWFRSRSRK